MNYKLIHENQYLSEDTNALAEYFLGKIIITHIGGKVTSGTIVETEAYIAPYDRGSHAYNFRRTKRTEVMYDRGGSAYVYMCYGIHPMINIVTGPQDLPHAILIRAIEPLNGLDTMQLRRGTVKNVTTGPGKTATALGISMEENGVKMFDQHSPIQIVDSEIIVEKEDIVATPRVGMSKHVGEYAHKPWRYYIKNNRYVSKPLLLSYEGKW